MAVLVVSSATVSVYHDPATGTGGCSVSIMVQETDAAGTVTQSGPINYSADDIGLTAQQKTTLDNIITTIKNAALNKFKNDAGNITAAPGV